MRTPGMGRNLYIPPSNSGRGGANAGAGAQQASVGPLPSLSGSSSRLLSSQNPYTGMSAAGCTSGVPDSPSLLSGGGGAGSESSTSSYFLGTSRYHSELSSTESLGQLADACRGGEAVQSQLSSMSKDILASLSQQSASLRQSGGKTASLLSVAASLQNHAVGGLRGAVGGGVKGEEKDAARGGRTSRLGSGYVFCSSWGEESPCHVFTQGLWR